MAEINSYKDLFAWQRTYSMGKSVYSLAGTFPEVERFGLIASLRRLSYSIASHIAQGYGRGVTSEYLWCLKQARGEIYSLDTQLMFALDFGYIPKPEYEKVKAELDEAERVLAGLIRSLGS